MKLFKKLILMAIILMLAVTLFACAKDDNNTSVDDNAENKQEEVVETVPSDKTFAPTDAYVKKLGRTHEQDETLWMVHSGTGAEFSFVGTKATITIKPDSQLNSGVDGQARVAIYVNGERVVDDMINKLEKTFTVFESEEPTECIVTIVKLSEAANSTAGISKIEVTSLGNIKPTENKEKLIEFIGDSITCGYGVDDENRDHHFSTTTEDVTKTYAYKTAKALEADYSMVSFSGYGIVSGYSGDGSKVSEQTLPQYYDKLGFSYGAYMGTYYAQDVEWDFTKRQPDVIVINLGTNDNSYVKGAKDKKQEYVTEYVEFLKKVREKNPNATIICTLGIMGSELYSSITAAVDNYQTETGDTNVYTMKFATQDQADGIAADWHPTEATHQKAADKLTAEIKTIMGW